MYLKYTRNPPSEYWYVRSDKVSVLYSIPHYYYFRHLFFYLLYRIFTSKPTNPPVNSKFILLTLPCQINLSEQELTSPLCTHFGTKPYLLDFVFSKFTPLIQISKFFHPINPKILSNFRSDLTKGDLTRV